MKRTTTILLATLCTIFTAFSSVDVWDGVTITAFDTVGGKGLTSENPVLIESGAHLAYLAQQVNLGTTAGGSDYDGV